MRGSCYAQIMNWLKALRNKVSGDVACSIGGDQIGFADGADGMRGLVPAFVALSVPEGRIVAVAEEAERLRRATPPAVKVVRVTRRGGFDEDEMGAAVIRFLLRRRPGAKWAAIPPRVLAVCPREGAVSVKNALIGAGAREVLILEPGMAAAVGCGLDYASPRPVVVFVLERDWCAFAVIAEAGNVVSFQLASGVDTLLEDTAIHTLATTGTVLDPDGLNDQLMRRGLETALALGLGEPESGRDRNAFALGRLQGLELLPFRWRLNWHYSRAMASFGQVKAREWTEIPVHFVGPYAQLPGMANLVGCAFQRAVIVPRDAETAVLRGAQSVLADVPYLTTRLRRRG